MHLARWLHKQWIILGLIALLAAAIIVAQPMYHDHAIYWRGGELLLCGGKLADDYLVKQPLIYLFFAAAQVLFGEYEWSYRLLDAAYQLATAMLIACVARSIGGNVLAAISATVYLLAYSTGAYVLGAHPESLAGLLLALVALVRYGERRWFTAAAYEGVLLALLLWLKLTFVLVGAALLLFDVLEHRPGLFRRWSITLLSGVAVSVIGLSLLSGAIEWATLPAVIEYLRAYGSTPPLHIAVVGGWHNLIRFTAENLTITVAALAGVGIIGLARSSHHSVVLWTALSVGMAASVVVERKFGVVHLWRMLPCLVIPVAAGSIIAARAIGQRWATAPSLYRWGMLAPLIIGAIVLSPLPRVSTSVAIPILALTDTARYNAAYQRTPHNVLHRQTLWQIAGFIQSRRAEHERVLLLSSCMSQLYVFLREPPWYHFSTTLPVFSVHVPSRWRMLYWRDLRQADWLVVSTLDRADALFGHSRTSWESLQTDTASARYVQSHFALAMETPIARVLRRTIPDVSQTVE